MKTLVLPSFWTTVLMCYSASTSSSTFSAHTKMSTTGSRFDWRKLPETTSHSGFGLTWQRLSQRKSSCKTRRTLVWTSLQDWPESRVFTASSASFASSRSSSFSSTTRSSSSGSAISTWELQQRRCSSCHFSAASWSISSRASGTLQPRWTVLTTILGSSGKT